MSDLGSTLCVLRRSSDFSALPRSSWLLFVCIACHWQRDPQRWPTKGAIARFSGYSLRGVRDGVDVLVERGVLVVRRELDDTGAELTFYGPGPTTLAQLGGMGDPDPPEKNARRHPSPREKNDGGFPSFLADFSRSSPLPIKKNKDLLLEEGDETGADDHAVACSALVEWFERTHPGAPTPRAFDDEAVALVTACAAALDGERDAKLRAMRDAIDGAFRTSRQAPRVRYIWGRLEYFLAHAERGKKARLAASPRPAAPPTPCPERRAPAEAPVRLCPTQMSADLDRVFGPSWRARA